MTTQPEYPLDYKQARIALMTEPEGTIIENDYGLQFKVEGLEMQIRWRPQSSWNSYDYLPAKGPRYRVIPIPAPEPVEPTPHVNMTLEECLAARVVRIHRDPKDSPYSDVDTLYRGSGWTLLEHFLIVQSLAAGFKITIEVK